VPINQAGVNLVDGPFFNKFLMKGNFAGCFDYRVERVHGKPGALCDLYFLNAYDFRGIEIFSIRPKRGFYVLGRLGSFLYIGQVETDEQNVERLEGLSSALFYRKGQGCVKYFAPLRKGRRFWF
jgi:hypothetical protein